MATSRAGAMVKGDLWSWCTCSKKLEGGTSTVPRHRVSVPSKHYVAHRKEMDNDRKQRVKSACRIFVLTGQQRHIVMRTWHKLSVDIPAMGISTMHALLDLDPEISSLFDFGDGKTVDLQFHPKFRQHAYWMIQTVSAMVENLDDRELMVSDMFIEIGEKHAGIKDFSPNYFSELPAAWSRVWEEQLRDRYTAQTDKSWYLIFQYIVNLLSEGCAGAASSSRAIVPMSQAVPALSVNSPSRHSSLVSLPIPRSPQLGSEVFSSPSEGVSSPTLHSNPSTSGQSGLSDQSEI